MILNYEQIDDLRIRLAKIAKLCKKARHDLSHFSGKTKEEKKIKKGLELIYNEVLDPALISLTL